MLGGRQGERCTSIQITNPSFSEHTSLIVNELIVSVIYHMLISFDVIDTWDTQSVEIPSSFFTSSAFSRFHNSTCSSPRLPHPSHSSFLVAPPLPLSSPPSPSPSPISPAVPRSGWGVNCPGAPPSLLLKGKPCICLLRPIFVFYITWQLTSLSPCSNQLHARTCVCMSFLDGCISVSFTCPCHPPLCICPFISLPLQHSPPCLSIFLVCPPSSIDKQY